MPYAQQLKTKQREMEQLFTDVAPSVKIAPILGMEEPFHYRDKVISPYAPGRPLKGRNGHGDAGAAQNGRNGRAGAKGKSGGAAGNTKGGARREILTGMYERGTHRLIPADACLVENETAKRVTLAIRDIMARWDMAPYNEDTGEGFVRHAVVRVGHESGEVLVTVVTNGEEFPSSKSFCRELVRRVPLVTTIVQNVNTRQTNIILGEKERVLYGPGFILDTLCGLSFRISSKSFYQVNSTQTAVLYNTAMEMANLGPGTWAIDAYCGTGTIGLVAASRGATRVIGVDSVESAISDARQNARHNGIENAEFIAADATAFMEELAVTSSRPEAESYPTTSSRPEASGGGRSGEIFAASESVAGAAKISRLRATRSARDDETRTTARSGQDGETAQDLVLFMDPPRSGSTPEFIAAAASLKPARVVYISCNPETQARDLREFARHGYRATRIQPVDMFPHTNHTECVVLIEPKSV